MGITADLVSYNCSLKFSDLPPDTVDRAKYFLLDFLGVAARGSQEESCSVLLSALQDMHPSDGETAVIGRKDGLPLNLAALANGTAGHSIELDDVNNSASLHPAVSVFPTALAVAQAQNCNAEEFITASVIGYETAIRLGIALDPPKHYQHGFHPTATCGALGAAATAAKLLRLNEKDTASVLGIAGSQAAGSMEYLTNGAWTKRIHPGWAANSGITAAYLAKNGYIGPDTIIEGKSGFLHSYSDGSDPAKVLLDLGEVFHINRTSIKPHACCRYKQSGIDGVLKIVRENGISPGDTRKIRVSVLSGGWEIVAHPPEQKRNPRSAVDAQFSMPYGAAVAVARGRAFIDEYDPELLDNPEITELMNKVECYTDPEMDREYPEHWPARVEIETTDGNRYSEEIMFPKGDPENPLTWDEIIAKFKSLCGPSNGGTGGSTGAQGIFSKERQEKIIAYVRSLERQPMNLLYGMLGTD